MKQIRDLHNMIWPGEVPLVLDPIKATRKKDQTGSMEYSFMQLLKLGLVFTPGGQTGPYTTGGPLVHPRLVALSQSLRRRPFPHL